LLTAGSRAIYARGVLALWIPASSKAAVERVQDLTLPGVHVIAVAKPELAPYGQHRWTRSRNLEFGSR